MSEKDNTREPDERFEKMSEAIRMACDRRLGVVDHNFLCASVSVLGNHKPVCVEQTTLTGQVVSLFEQKGIGSVIVTGDGGRVVGIFTERDCVRRVMPALPGSLGSPITDFMTRDPVTQQPDITIAFALNLMSHGGFRHVPLVDGEGVPVGIISVRDVVDYLANSLVEDLLSFDTGSPD